MKRLIICLLIALLIFFKQSSISAFDKKVNLEIREKKQAMIFYEFEKFYLKEESTKLFQDSFAGSYFDENDVLHLNFASLYEDQITKQYEFSDWIKVEYVDNSLRELKEVQDFYNKNFYSHSISKTSINIEKNSLEIYFSSEATKFQASSLLDLTNFTDIYLIYDDLSIQATSTHIVVNGDDFQLNMSDDCSIGFPAKNSCGYLGFVTAGHCIVDYYANIGDDIYIDGDIAGEVDSYIFEDYSSADAAFIKLDTWGIDKWLPSDNLVFGKTIYSYDTSTTPIPINTLVSFYGSLNHSSVVTGYVTSNSVTGIIGTSNGFTAEIENMVKVDFATMGGDSGGPIVRMLYIGGGQYVREVFGVCNGTDYYNSYYSTLANIFDELDLSEYN